MRDDILQYKNKGREEKGKGLAVMRRRFPYQTPSIAEKLEMRALSKGITVESTYP